MVWTGIEWDTAEFSCEIPEEKLLKAERKIQSLLSRVDKKVPVKDLASVVGLLNSFRFCVGEEMSRFYTRRASIQIAQETEENQWSRWICLRGDVIQELRFWLRMLRKSNGYRIRQEEEVITFDCLGGSDAGGHQAGGALVEDLQPVVDSIFKFHLSSEDQKKSSTFRELLGLKEGLELLAERLRGKRVLWRNDNWAVSLIVQLGL